MSELRTQIADRVRAARSPAEPGEIVNDLIGRLEEAESLGRIEHLLERIAVALEADHGRASYDSALQRWVSGSGKHPDD